MTKKQDSRWYDVEYVPHNYVFPEEDRPGKSFIPVCHTIPAIDLGNQKAHTIDQIMKATQEFGFFQVINHGVSENIIVETVNVLKEFFEMHAEIPKISGTGVHMWRDNIKHLCHPMDKLIQSWPENPTRYREVVAMYLVEMRKLGLRILELICEGLGVEEGYFNEISEVQLFSVNNCPPCPDPSVTLGVMKHVDPTLITILFQGDVGGLQVLKDGQWIAVGALPNAFVVNIGNQLEIISNGKLKSAEHRVVTNSKEARLSIATSIDPSLNCIVEPAKVLVNELNPPRYKPTLYKDFVYASKAYGADTEATLRTIISET